MTMKFAKLKIRDKNPVFKKDNSFEATPMSNLMRRTYYL